MGITTANFKISYLGGIRKNMTKIFNSFDSYQELKQMNIKRLFITQNMLLKDLDYYLYTQEDRNLANESLQNIIIINKVITKKLEKVKK